MRLVLSCGFTGFKVLLFFNFGGIDQSRIHHLFLTYCFVLYVREIVVLD